MMLIQLPKKKVDPGARSPHAMGTGNGKDAVSTFKSHSLTAESFSEWLTSHCSFSISFKPCDVHRVF